MDNSNLTQDDLIDIKMMATVATSIDLTYFKGITEVDQCYDALIYYFNLRPEQLKVWHLPPNKDLRLKHEMLSLKKGYGQLLNIIISLTLFEKEFRENGINDKKSIEKYNKLVKDYQNALDFFVNKPSKEQSV